VNLQESIRRIALGIAWVLVAAVIALGAAGVVAAMTHPPGTTARPELTWAGDRAATPALDAATIELQALSNRVDTLASTARTSLTQVVGGDLEGLGATLARGDAEVTAATEQAVRLDAALDAIPGVVGDTPLGVSDAVVRRYDALAVTRDVTAGLQADWAAFTGRAINAAKLTGLLARHDAETAAAAKEGSAGHYKKALSLLDKPDATIAQTQTLRDDLASTTDVSTLSEWVDRNATYDAALRDLYRALLDSKGRVTSAVRKAFAFEQAARVQLPTDTRALVVIMGDLAQGGLNQAVISIEQARGALSAAIDAQQQLQPDTEPEP
jgi:hypothetical protein